MVELPDLPNTVASVGSCVADVSNWLHCNRLLCNNDKTEYLLIRSKFSRLTFTIPSIRIVDCVVDPSDSARNLGVIFDKHMSLQPHIMSVARSANIGIRNIARIRKYLSFEAARLYVQLLVTSKLDFCNSLLSGLPAASLKPLVKAQNAAARLITKTRRCDHITPILRELHWLPVAERVQYKTLMLTFRALHGLAPPYLSDLLPSITSIIF